MKAAIQKSKFMIKNWWLLLVVGTLFILAGAWTINTPQSSYVSLAIIFASFMFVSGIFSLVFSITNRKEIDDWGWHLAGSVFDFVVGAILFFHPAVTMAVLPFMVAFYFLFKGFATFGFAADMRKYGDKGWGWLVFSGILSTVFAIMIIFNPTLGGLTIVVFTAFAFFSLGFFNIILAFSLKKLKERAGDLKEIIGDIKKSVSGE
ncbi:HdeD family acid-resistance protein [Shivajiella indica]|uniref:HdeD family acid-resistance protein n=1 Tax=Shivajiella indica TaxID=872115 RepID=A0ABW5B8V3_9BACT